MDSPHIQLSQVFLNLFVNAFDAMPESQGQLTISSLVNSKGLIEVAVVDNGSGIPQCSIDRIFEPFFTTKSAGEGTGLGLHICRQIVHAHDGHIRVDSHINEGTAFTVELPVRVESEKRL